MVTLIVHAQLRDVQCSFVMNNEHPTDALNADFVAYTQGDASPHYPVPVTMPDAINASHVIFEDDHAGMIAFIRV